MKTVFRASILRYPRSLTRNTLLGSSTSTNRRCPRQPGTLPALFPSAIPARSLASGPDSDGNTEGTDDTINDNSDSVLLLGVESFHGYQVGGYHPVRIGGRLHDRYRILNKLGHGSYSTAWLALDEKTNTYVALKIGLGNVNSNPESEILHLLLGSDAGPSPHPGRATIPSVIDEFGIDGPNGHHRCLVKDLARVSIAEMRGASGRYFQTSVARAIAAQFVQAVAFLHSRGVVHSDLHQRNILLRLPDSIQKLTPDQLYEEYGDPVLGELERIDGEPLDSGMPAYLAIPVWFGIEPENLPLSESSILLSDFGESFRPGKTQRNRTRIPAVLRPPELLIFPKTPISFSADIWALGCVLFEILGCDHLFNSVFRSEDEVLLEQVDALGCLPAELWAHWSNSSKHFDDNLVRRDGEAPRSLETRFERYIRDLREHWGMEEIGEEEKVAFLGLLKSTFAYNPADRPSAQEVLESEWMVKWALPDLQKSQAPESEPGSSRARGASILALHPSIQH